MYKGHAVAQQADASIGVGSRRAILQVALDGATDMSQLRADLMVASREQVDFEQHVAVATPDDLVAQHSLLAARHLVVVGIGLVLSLVAHQPVGQQSLRFGRLMLDDGPVGLVDLTLAKQIVEAAQRLRGLGKDDQSGHGAVQAVDHTEKDVARLLIFLLQPFLDGIGERKVARLVALYDFAHLLIDDDDVVVLVEWLHRALHVHAAIDLDDLAADIA